MNYIDFPPKILFLLTYLGYGLLVLFKVNKCKIMLSTEKVDNLWQAWRQKWKEWEDELKAFSPILIRSEQIWKPKLVPRFFSEGLLSKTLDIKPCCLWGWVAAFLRELWLLRKWHLQVLREMMMERDSLEPLAQVATVAVLWVWPLLRRVQH